MKPHVLIILDGWGISKEKTGNAVFAAKTPTMDRLSAEYPSTLLQASGPAVGLPPNEDGNSEVGHMNLGAGRIVYQELPRINIQIADGQFFKNRALRNACLHAKQNNSRLALLGLVGPGTVHSSLNHLYALLKLASQEGLTQEQVQLHLFTDGRDSSIHDGLETIKTINDTCRKYGVGKICSISGRYYAMDRNKTWDRTELAYKAITEVIGEHAPSAEKALENSYEQDVSDEFVKPTIINASDGKPRGLIDDNDAVIFINYRADRARQLTKAFVLPEFNGFSRSKHIQNLYFVTMTEYEKGLPVREIAYPDEDIVMSMSETLSKHGLKQYHIAETEKYAHVTYFFNGRREQPFMGEDRLLIPSPKVPTYDQKPEMSATEITETVLEKLSENRYDFIVLNFANPDMVAHTGNFEATIIALEHVDHCLQRIVEKVQELSGSSYITADHGNAEELKIKKSIFKTEIATSHTTNPVPFIIVSEEAKKLHKQLEGGVLGDVAPTILYFIDIPQPMEMTGRVLFI